MIITCTLAKRLILRSRSLFQVALLSIAMDVLLFIQEFLYGLWVCLYTGVAGLHKWWYPEQYYKVGKRGGEGRGGGVMWPCQRKLDSPRTSPATSPL